MIEGCMICRGDVGYRRPMYVHGLVDNFYYCSDTMELEDGTDVCAVLH